MSSSQWRNEGQARHPPHPQPRRAPLGAGRSPQAYSAPGPPPQTDPGRRPQKEGHPGDYDFLLNHGIAPDALSFAQATAEHWGVSTHEALITLGWLSEANYIEALAQALGLRAMTGDVRLALFGREHEPQVPFSGLVRMAPERGQDGAGDHAFALDGQTHRPGDIRRLLAIAGLEARHVVLLPRSVLWRGFEAAAAARVMETAVNGLRRGDPAMSAGMPLWLWQGIAMACAVGLVIGGFAVAPILTTAALTGLMAVPFLCVVFLRALALVIGLGRGRGGRPRAARMRCSDLPVYSILVPLFREAAILPDLVSALAALDYPAPKLDVILVLEAADDETPAALAGLPLPPNFRVVTVPDAQPRTKPKALNYALQLARGDFVVVYDAEDMPEPDQLRKALDRFAEGPPDLACVQARLNVYNPRASWLSRQFCIEYSALFDALLPALERLDIPVPLGGTSNHFPRAVLERLGGWDPFNVTEDADLGIRMARAGLGTTVLESTTWEEAPRELATWTKQRTRWLKGWMQTYLVHSRQPMRLMRELGLKRWCGLHILMGGILLSVLVHPLFYLLLAWELAFGRLLDVPESPLALALWIIAGVNLTLGYLSSMLLGAVAVVRRGRPGLALQALTMPVYWLLISFAGFRALWQVTRDPYGWEKTDHTSRSKLGGNRR